MATIGDKERDMKRFMDWEYHESQVRKAYEVKAGVIGEMKKW